MNTVYTNKNNCCGCSACAQRCPQNCINMKEDDKGFVYPVVDSGLCIDCGLCKKVCFFQGIVEKQKPIECFAYYNENEKYRLKSASSGAFESLCRAFIGNEKYFYIVGCTLSESLTVKHSIIDSFDDIDIFKKSKYLQSDINNTFGNIEDMLAKGGSVVFSGTPCQVQGLKQYLRKDYDNLFLVDFVCHGVPSQYIFNSYLAFLEKKHRSKVIMYEFRNKKKINEKWSNLGVKYKLANGKTMEIESADDLYMRGFLSGLYNRDCCYECEFAQTDRVSDITIGDFWGIGQVYPQLSETITNGTSLILVNTAKGKSIIENLKPDSLYKAELRDAIRENGQLSHPQTKNTSRDDFFRAFSNEGDFAEAMKLVYPSFSRDKIKRRLARMKWYNAISRCKYSVIKHVFR